MPVLQSALRDRRLAQQHAAYRELAVGISESGGYAIPKAVGADVERYAQPPAASTRAGEQADPRSPRAPGPDLGYGRVPSRSTVERALGGVRSNSSPQTRAGDCYPTLSWPYITPARSK